MTSSEMSQRFLANQMTDGAQRDMLLKNWLINIDKKLHKIRYSHGPGGGRLSWLNGQKARVKGFDGHYQSAQRL